jgi:hypothetical protein
MACSTHGNKLNTYRVLLGKPEGKKCEDNIKMDLIEIE